MSEHRTRDPGKAHLWMRNNILGLVAIFVALGGTAIAAQVASNGPDANARVAKKKKAKRGPRGPAGPQGVAGQPGPQGPAGPSTGSAGGALAGTYPNPTIATGAIGTSEFSASIPAARVTNSGDQTIGNTGVTALAFDTERYDTANLHTSGNNTLLTAPVAGIYAITAQVQWASNATGFRQVSLQKNAASFLAVDTRNAVGGVTNTTAQTVTTQARLAAGDFVRAQVYQDSGGDLAVKAFSELSPEFSMTWLAPG